MSGMFKLSWTDVSGALVSAVMMGVLASALYVLGVGDVFKLDWHALANAGVLAVLTGLVSLIKSYLTDANGNFVGAVQVKPPQQ